MLLKFHCKSFLLLILYVLDQTEPVACYFMSREFAAFRLTFNNGNRNYILSVASNVSIASDDDQIQAHK